MLLWQINVQCKQSNAQLKPGFHDFWLPVPLEKSSLIINNQIAWITELFSVILTIGKTDQSVFTNQTYKRHSTDKQHFHLTLMMTSTQVVETSVTVTDNSPFQDYLHPDDHTSWSIMAQSWKPGLSSNLRFDYW